MRDPKYRVWDNKEEKFLTEVEVEFVHDSISWGKEFFLEVKEDLDHYDPTRYIFSQYTGLKDVNDRDIYEGDIIEIRHPHKGRYYKGRIEYSELSARFLASDFYFPHYDDPNDFTEGMEYVEVVGNIYEN